MFGVAASVVVSEIFDTVCPTGRVFIQRLCLLTYESQVTLASEAVDVIDTGAVVETGRRKAVVYVDIALITWQTDMWIM